MANETRPRREPTGTSRIRKTVTPPLPPVADDSSGTAPGPVTSYPGASESSPAPAENQRDRQDRERFREEGPADREPIRYIRQRDREPVREPAEREPGLSVRERLRATGPIATAGRSIMREFRSPATAIVTGRPRRPYANAPAISTGATPPIPGNAPSARQLMARASAMPRAIANTGRPPASNAQFRPPLPRRPPAFPKRKKTSSAMRRFTIATKTSSAVRFISPSCRG